MIPVPTALDEQAVAAMAAGRLARLRATMVDDSIDLLVLHNPVSLRYAVEYRGYNTFQAHIPTAYLLLPVEGPVVMHGAYAVDVALVDEARPANAVTGFDSGLDQADVARRFAADVVAVLDEVGLGTGARVGVERLLPTAHHALTDAGIHAVDAEGTIELARSCKSDLEMVALGHAIDVAEHGMAVMEAALVPGMTENGLWSLIHQVNVAHDGDWFDGRMLCSGPRTNPWYQEAGPRIIEGGDLVAFDTDMIGPFGYCADISRTFLCRGIDGPGWPTDAQRRLYDMARHEVEHNTALLRVGASFRELSAATWRQPDDVLVNRYACAFHGVGMSDEYPKIPYPDDWERCGYDGEVTDGLVLSVESYVGPDGGAEGVKLEQMVQVIADGVVPLSTYPLWDEEA
jgi:Xaa-Pro dipeptidase